MRPAISVIVAFRDVRPHLAGCIASLLDQTLSSDDYELIFVDNGSTDGGSEVVAAQPGIRLLTEARTGVYTARNRGLREAKGGILAFTDPDCHVDRDWLERISAALAVPEAGIVLGHRLAATDRGLLPLLMAYESEKAAYVTSRGIGGLVFGHANNMALSRSVIECVGPFPEIPRGGDTVLVQRAVATYGCRVVRFLPDLRVRHLEVDTVSGYYGKAWTYGRSNEHLRSMVGFRSLCASERWEVFRRTISTQNLSAARGALLLAALVPGWLCYEWGRHASDWWRGGNGHRTGPRDL